jgi:hypothetical protein
MTDFIVAWGKHGVAQELAEKVHLAAEAFAAASKAGRCFCSPLRHG